MIIDKIALEICFELNNSPKNFKLTDTTDYLSEGIALADVEGLFKITAPDGTISYENAGFALANFAAQDIDADVSLIFNTVSLPLDSEGEVQLGNYLVEYKIEVIGAVQPGVYTKSFSVENCHVDPIIDVNFVTDCFNSKLTSTDNTDYSTELVPVPTSIVRTHTAFSPPTSGLGDTVTPNKILVASPISTKTWTLKVSSIVRWDYPDGLCIINTLVGDIEAEVTCDVSICDIFCCIDKLYKRYKSQLGINSVLASQIKDQLDTVSIDLVLFENALKCGQNYKAQAYYDHILEVTGCEPGCSCTDVDTVQVIPVTVVTGTAVVDACGNGAITVTPNTSGNTTTYTICFQQSLLDKLNASFNTTLTAGTNISIVPTVSINGDISYEVISTATSPPIPYLELSDITISPSFNPAVGKYFIYGELILNRIISLTNGTGANMAFGPSYSAKLICYIPPFDQTIDTISIDSVGYLNDVLGTSVGVNIKPDGSVYVNSDINTVLPPGKALHIILPTYKYKNPIIILPAPPLV